MRASMVSRKKGKKEKDEKTSTIIFRSERDGGRMKRRRSDVSEFFFDKVGRKEEKVTSTDMGVQRALSGELEKKECGEMEKESEGKEKEEEKEKEGKEEKGEKGKEEKGKEEKGENEEKDTEKEKKEKEKDKKEKEKDKKKRKKKETGSMVSFGKEANPTPSHSSLSSSPRTPSSCSPRSPTITSVSSPTIPSASSKPLKPTQSTPVPPRHSGRISQSSPSPVLFISPTSSPSSSNTSSPSPSPHNRSPPLPSFRSFPSSSPINAPPSPPLLKRGEGEKKEINTRSRSGAMTEVLEKKEEGKRKKEREKVRLSSLVTPSLLHSMTEESQDVRSEEITNAFEVLIKAGVFNAGDLINLYSSSSPSSSSSTSPLRPSSSSPLRPPSSPLPSPSSSPHTSPPLSTSTSSQGDIQEMLRKTGIANNLKDSLPFSHLPPLSSPPISPPSSSPSSTPPPSSSPFVEILHVPLPPPKKPLPPPKNEPGSRLSLPSPSPSPSSSPLFPTALPNDLSVVPDDITICSEWKRVSRDLEGEVGRMVKGVVGKKGGEGGKKEGWGLYEMKLMELGGKEGEGEEEVKAEKREVGPYSTVFLVEKERVRQTEAVVLNRITHWGEQSRSKPKNNSQSKKLWTIQPFPEMPPMSKKIPPFPGFVWKSLDFFAGSLSKFPTSILNETLALGFVPVLFTQPEGFPAFSDVKSLEKYSNRIRHPSSSSSTSFTSSSSFCISSITPTVSSSAASSTGPLLPTTSQSPCPISPGKNSAFALPPSQKGGLPSSQSFSFSSSRSRDIIQPSPTPSSPQTSPRTLTTFSSVPKLASPSSSPPSSPPLNPPISSHSSSFSMPTLTSLLQPLQTQASILKKMFELIPQLVFPSEFYDLYFFSLAVHPLPLSLDLLRSILLHLSCSSSLLLYRFLFSLLRRIALVSVYGGEEKKTIVKKSEEQPKGTEERKFKRDLEVIFRRQSSVILTNTKVSPRKFSKSPGPSPSPSPSPALVGESSEGVGGIGWGFGTSRGSVVGSMTMSMQEEKKGKKKREKEKDKKKKKGKGGGSVVGGVGSGVGGGVGGSVGGGVGGGIESPSGPPPEILKRMGDGDGKHKEAMRAICGEICELTLSSSPSNPSIPPLYPTPSPSISPSPSPSSLEQLPQDTCPSSCPPPSFFSSLPTTSSSTLIPSLPILDEEGGEDKTKKEEPILSPRKLKLAIREGVVSPTPISPRWREDKREKKNKKKGWKGTLALRGGASKDIIDNDHRHGYHGHHSVIPTGYRESRLEGETYFTGEEAVNEQEEDKNVHVGNSEENHEEKGVNTIENNAPENEEDEILFHFEEEKTEEREEIEREEEGDWEKEGGEGGDEGDMEEEEEGELDEEWFSQMNELLDTWSLKDNKKADLLIKEDKTKRSIYENTISELAKIFGPILFQNSGSEEATEIVKLIILNYNTLFHPTEAGSICFETYGNTSSPFIKWGSPARIVSHLFNRYYHDPNFISIVFHFHEYFLTRKELFEMMLAVCEPSDPTPATSALMSHFIDLVTRWFKGFGDSLVNDKEFDTAFLEATNRLPFLDWIGLMKLRSQFKSKVRQSGELPKAGSADGGVWKMNQSDKKKKRMSLQLNNSIDMSQASEEFASLFMANFEVEELAKEITLRDFQRFKDIPATEFIKKRFTKEDTAPMFHAIISQFNKMSLWACAEILYQPSQTRRIDAYTRMIRLCVALRKMNNFQTCYAIVSGLQLSCVSRLKQTWEKIPKKVRAQFEQLLQTFDITENHKNLRDALKESVPPSIPYVGLYSKLLLNIEESMSTFISKPETSEKLVNFHKFRSLMDILKDITQYSALPYPFQSNEKIKNCLNSIPLYDEGVLYKHSVEVVEPRKEQKKKAKKGSIAQK